MIVNLLNASGPFAWQEAKGKREVYAAIGRYHVQISGFKEKGKALNELEDLFELPMSKLSVLAAIEDELR